MAKVADEANRLARWVGQHGGRQSAGSAVGVHTATRGEAPVAHHVAWIAGAGLPRGAISVVGTLFVHALACGKSARGLATSFCTCCAVAVRLAGAGVPTERAATSRRYDATLRVTRAVGRRHLTPTGAPGLPPELPEELLEPPLELPELLPEPPLEEPPEELLEEPLELPLASGFDEMASLWPPQATARNAAPAKPARHASRRVRVMIRPRPSERRAACDRLQVSERYRSPRASLRLQGPCDHAFTSSAHEVAPRRGAPPGRRNRNERLPQPSQHQSIAATVVAAV